MTTDVAVVTTTARADRRGRRGGADAAVARRAFGQLWRGAGIWSLVFGGTAAASALTYATSFPTLVSRQELAATTGSATGLGVLLGPVAGIDTVGGYTVYKCFVFLTTIGAIWAVLAATRLLRGEEDVGRWQLVLAGDTRPARATAATLAALGAAVAVMFCGMTAVVALVGRRSDVGFGVGQSVLYGLSIAIAPLVFAGLGALASQLGRTRRLATGLGMGVFGVMFVLRMIADSGAHTQWLLWLTPFGWTELVRPFTEDDLWPLLVAVAATIGLCVAASSLASRRDAGDGVLAARDVSSLRPFGLRSPFGLAARLELPLLGSWCAGAAVAAFALGIVAKVTTAMAPGSLGDTLENFGVRGSFADQYFGVAFLLVATLVALLPAGQIGATSEEEASGRLVHVLVRPTGRARWLGGRLVLGGAGVVAAGLLAGLAAWLGATSQGVDVDLGTMVGAGLNVVPTALVALGIGAVALSVAPRAAVRAVYGVVIGSLIVDLVASMVSGLAGLGHLSLFHYMALAPARHPDPATLVVTVAAAGTLCLLSLLFFARRDVSSG
ncbi:MAG: polyether ionophore transport system permease protein [Actinomycetota bacterium]|nr:polyether ionophore transport system permease protein [Actinomycetota bacterium]